MKRSRLATSTLIPVLALTAGCAEVGYSHKKGYTGQGRVVEYDENHVIIDTITNSRTRGGMTAYSRIEVQDAYRDLNCTAHEVSNALDDMIAAGTIAAGMVVRFDVDEGRSKEHCTPGTAKNGWFQDRVLLVDIAPVS